MFSTRSKLWTPGSGRQVYGMNCTEKTRDAFPSLREQNVDSLNREAPATRTPAKVLFPVSASRLSTPRSSGARQRGEVGWRRLDGGPAKLLRSEAHQPNPGRAVASPCTLRASRRPGDAAVVCCHGNTRTRRVPPPLRRHGPVPTETQTRRRRRLCANMVRTARRGAGPSSTGTPQITALFFHSAK